MIDFPNSPTDGQIFSATNGVVYKYSATYTSWLAQNPTPAIGGTGDFCAVQTSSFPALTASFATLILTQVMTGNAGLWYSTSTGRYTPPAGRYVIEAGFTAFGTNIQTFGLQLRKNGTVLPPAYDSCPSVNYYANPALSLIVDANGTDWFDIQGVSGGGGGGTMAGLYFQAFPLTGMQGPTGGAPGSVVGDFYATGAPGTAISVGSAAIVIAPNVITGNSGAYYNTSTGRWTPPAGRYLLFGFVGGQAGGGAATTTSVFLYKNGVVIPNVGTAFYSAVASGLVSPYTSAIVDANGSDVFDLRASASAATTLTSLGFGASPTQGMVGPQGPPGPPGVTPDIPQNSQAGNYTLVLADDGKHIYHPVAAAAAAWLIPDNSSVVFNIGTAITFVNDSANAVTINTIADTLVLSPAGTTGLRSLAQSGMATALKVTATRWMISGVGLT